MMKARARTAARIAGLDPDRLNEWIAAGDYPCAPQTVPGKVRIFSEREIVGLCVFERLMADGMAAYPAGHIACDVVELAASFTPPLVIVSGGGAFACTADTLLGYISESPSAYVMVFKIDTIAKRITAALTEEQSIVGDE